MPGSHREADREPRSDLLPGVKEAGRCTGISRTPPKSPERTDEPDGIDQHIRQEHANQAPAKCALDMLQLQHHRSEERRVGKECVSSVDLGGRSISKKTKRKIPTKYRSI